MMQHWHRILEEKMEEEKKAEKKGKLIVIYLEKINHKRKTWPNKTIFLPFKFGFIYVFRKN